MKSHNYIARRSIATITVLVLIATYAAFFGLATRARLSLVVLASLVGVVVMKYVWWKSRRQAESKSRRS